MVAILFMVAHEKERQRDEAGMGESKTAGASLWGGWGWLTLGSLGTVYRGVPPFPSPRCWGRILVGKGFTGRTGDTLLKTYEVRSRILKANGLF
jgi:hypothetical protein